MLPIPERIIGSKRLFIPLVYVGVTVTLCYYFVLAFVHMPRIPIAAYNTHTSSNNNNHPEYYYNSFLKSSSNNNDNEKEKNQDDDGQVVIDDIIEENEGAAGSNNNNRGTNNEDDDETDNNNNIIISEEAAEVEREQGILLPLRKRVENSLKKEDRLDRRSVKTTNTLFHNKNYFQLNQSSSSSSSNHIHQNGTGRSKSSKIWSRHQDRPHWIDMEEGAPVHSPWPNDEEEDDDNNHCQQFSVRFAKKHTFTPRALVSFPGSGNSWLRYLLEGSTGIFTGSIFNDPALFHSGLLGEYRSPVDGSTLIQKTHDDSLVFSRNTELFKKMTELVFKYRGILLIRNPYDALHSYWNFINTRDHKGHAPSNQSFQKWKVFVEQGSKKWAQLIQDWLENSEDLLLVQYEELKANPRKQLLRILDYLAQPVNELRLNCVIKHLKGPFQREHHHDNSVVNNNNNNNSLPDDPLPSFTSNNSHLDLIVQENVEHINRLLAIKEIPLRLNYTLN